MKLPRLFVMLALLPSSGVMLFGSVKYCRKFVYLSKVRYFSFISSQYFSYVLASFSTRFENPH